MDWRGQKAKSRANREKALFSHIWNMARAWGVTNQPNPCAGIKGFEEKGRDIYIEDDVLGMDVTDIRDGALQVRQGKTGQKLRIEVVGELLALIDRIERRKAGVKIHSLALICNNARRALTKEMLRTRFENARKLAAKQNPALAQAIQAFQFRDLRAKAGTDKAESEDIHAAQLQLGHSTITMTEHYVRARLGQRVKPTK